LQLIAYELQMQDFELHTNRRYIRQP